MLLPLLVATVVNLGVLLLGVVPLTQNVAATESAALQAGIDLANARLLERQARDATASRARADQELSRFYSEVLPKDFPTASRTANRWLQEAARESGLDFKGSHFEWDALRDSQLSRAYSTVTLSGRYNDVRRFLYSVETAQEFIVVEEVALAQTGITPGGAGGAIEVSLKVATYFLTTTGGQR
ncbi:MAG: hypothetical protein IT181_20635 [Acidobacteria bacterium]|nr:hypothetical protein [Acidobacteriota bacterium]